MSDAYNAKMQAAFQEEAEEILVELETSLMELEENPGNGEVINQVFRALHTLKGSGSMFGFDQIGSFAHEIESVYDLVRSDKLAVSADLISTTLAARDRISAMLSDEEDVEISENKNRDIIEKLKLISLDSTADPDGIPDRNTDFGEEPDTDNVTPSALAAYRIRFKPSTDIFMHGTNPVNLIDELKTLGDCHISAYLDDFPAVEDFNPEYCYVFWDIILATKSGINAIKDVFIFVEDDSELNIEIIDDSTEDREDTVAQRLGEILVRRGILDNDTLGTILDRQKPIGEMLIQEGISSKPEIESALAEQAQIKKIRETREKAQKESSIRVGSYKLDKLVDIVGELVTLQAGLSQKAIDKQNMDFLPLAEEIERITATLRDLSMSLRMVPIETTFTRFRRLVRDLSQQLGKNIELRTEGGETQLDATIIERLVEPLIHLIRNSIDHGIEHSGDRIKAGKEPRGTIDLQSIHSGAYVLIQIKDDGRGMDADLILEKAVQKSIISPGTSLSEKEIYKLVFAPGFSTAQQITGVSGRGVGMDVVKKTIEELGGNIDVESEMGKGTVITLKIPLTLAIIEGLLVRINKDHYIIPLSAVEECIEMKMSDADRMRETNQVNVRGSLVPYVNLRKIFMSGGVPPAIDHIVIVNSEGRKSGLLVDEVIGEQQTVVKNLGIVYKDVEGISGATILGDGTIALILDILKLNQTAESVIESV